MNTEIIKFLAVIKMHVYVMYTLTKNVQESSLSKQ